MKFDNCFKGGLGLLVALMLMLGGCGGGSGADSTAPSLTIDPIPTDIARVSDSTRGSLTLGGTVEAGASVLVTVGSTDYAATVTNTTWTSNEIKLAPGANAITVRAEDATGNSNSLGFSLTYDAVSIEVYTTPVADGGETIYGLVDPGQTVLQVTVTPPSGNQTVLNPQVDPVFPDKWSLTLSGLETGDNTVTISATVPNQTAPVERSVTITVNADAPSLAINPANNSDFLTSAIPSQLIKGTLAAGNTNLAFSPVPTGLAPTIDPATGTDWTAALPTLAIGKNPLLATLTGSNGVVVKAHGLFIVKQEPPLVRQVSPVNGAEDVATNGTATVTARFDVAMDKALVEAGFTLVDDSLAPVDATLFYDDTTKTATLTPTSSLVAGTTYTAILSTTIHDAGGKALAQELRWSFTTAP